MRLLASLPQRLVKVTMDEPHQQLRFKLNDDSKFNNPSSVQTNALHIIEQCAPESGIVVLPCGAGKTMVFLQAALSAGMRVLFLCYEKQGVVQVAETIRQHSNVRKSQLCVYTSDIKTEPNSFFCYMVRPQQNCMGG